MASEYLKKKYRGVKPDAHRALTPAEKRKNWWHYHKWHVGIAAVLLLIGVDWGYHAATQIHPDYQIAYVGAAPLPGGAAAAWESRLVALGADCSGDGRVTVRLHSYLSPGEDAMAGYAASVKLLADLEACDSYFFLLEDPEAFQDGYEILREDWFPVEGGLYLARRAFWEDRTAEYMEECDLLWERLLEEAAE